MSKRFLPVIIVIAALVIAVTGCSAPLPRQNTVELKTVKIGVILPMAGEFGQYGPLCKNAIDLAADQINMKGGVLGGRRIEVLPGDDTSNGNVAQSAAANYAVQKVTAIVGPYTNESAIMAGPVANINKIPMMTIRASEPNITQLGNFIFRACFVDTYQGTILARFAAQDLKAKTAAIIYDKADLDGKTLSENFKKEFAKYGGKVSSMQTHDHKDTKFDPYLEQVAKEKPDVLFIQELEDNAGVIMKKARAMGIKSIFLGTNTWDSQKLEEIAGNAAVGTFMSDHFTPEDPNKLVQEFSKAYEGDYGGKPGPSAALAYDAVNLIVQAIKNANSDDPIAVRDALAKIKNYKGVTGTFTIDTDRNPIKGGVIAKMVEGGQEFYKRVEP
ncbi:MAG TPA: ABC transporter substrate-binding protein [Candidatus Aquicultor sp.]